MSVDFFFAWPWLLLALPLPWVLLRLLPPAPPAVMLKLPSLAGMEAMAGRKWHGARRLCWLAWLIWSLLVLAAARPQWPEAESQPVSGRSLMLAFDLSASMATRDMAHQGQTVARVDAALELARTFLVQRQGDRVGLIVFGKQAYLHVPPTLDMQAVRDALAGVRVGLAGSETALGDALALGTQQLRAQPEAARVLVLLTDGANTAGTLSPQRSAWLAQRESVRIHAVGLGGSARKSAAFDLDEPTLQAVTGQTGGHYARATDAAALQAFFDTINRLEPLPDRDLAQRPAIELYPVFLLPALLILAWLARQRHPFGSFHATRDDFLSRAVDAHLLAHVQVVRSPGRATGWLFWLLAAVLLILPGLPWDKTGDAFRALPLRVLLADLSSPAQEVQVRSKLAALLPALPPGETALIVYAGDAYLAVPPTRDAQNILALLPELAADILPVPGRNPARAEALARDLMARYPGRPARWWHVDATTDVAVLLEQSQELQGWRRIGLTENGGRVLWVLFPLLMIFALLELRRYGARTVMSVLLASTFLWLSLWVPTEAQAADNEWLAVTHYRMGRYEAVLQALDGKTDATSHYNRGNALARLGRFAAAEQAYAAALELQPGDEDAHFNLELMRKLQGQPPESSRSGTGKPPPARSDSPPAQSEAQRAAEQWLRGARDPGGLLRAKLRLEHERRLQEGR